ncbi:uncharacterized protein FFNC_12903 [Fusarium fujikuroi]|nr:uncharacterized protein FFNC_12903 [Fusarium fujikuroi]
MHLSMLHAYCNLIYFLEF